MLMAALIGEYSLDLLTAYMRHIQNNAGCAVRDILQKLHREHKGEDAAAADDGDPPTRP